MHEDFRVLEIRSSRRYSDHVIAVTVTTFLKQNIINSVYISHASFCICVIYRHFKTHNIKYFYISGKLTITALSQYFGLSILLI